MLNFPWSGNIRKITMNNTCRVNYTLVGGGGGGGGSDSAVGTEGFSGGRVGGYLFVNAGDVLYLAVGGGGSPGVSGTRASGGLGGGSLNGYSGGLGGASGSVGWSGSGGGGGGATVLYKLSGSTVQILAVAHGGAGGGGGGNRVEGTYTTVSNEPSSDGGRGGQGQNHIYDGGGGGGGGGGYVGGRGGYVAGHIHYRHQRFGDPQSPADWGAQHGRNGTNYISTPQSAEGAGDGTMTVVLPAPAAAAAFGAPGYAFLSLEENTVTVENVELVQSLSAYQSNTWKRVEEVYIKQNNEWKTTDVYARNKNEWVIVHGDKITYSTYNEVSTAAVSVASDQSYSRATGSQVTYVPAPAPPIWDEPAEPFILQANKTTLNWDNVVPGQTRTGTITITATSGSGSFTVQETRRATNSAVTVDGVIGFGADGKNTAEKTYTLSAGQSITIPVSLITTPIGLGGSFAATAVNGEFSIVNSNNQPNIVITHK